MNPFISPMTVFLTVEYYKKINISLQNLFNWSSSTIHPHILPSNHPAAHPSISPPTYTPTQPSICPFHQLNIINGWMFEWFWKTLIVQLQRILSMSWQLNISLATVLKHKSFIVLCCSHTWEPKDQQINICVLGLAGTVINIGRSLILIMLWHQVVKRTDRFKMV